MIEDDNQKGCRKLKKDVSTKNWIALVERGQCTFIEKVRNMQASGAIAVVVGDNEKNGLITMYATGELSNMICIYLFFICLFCFYYKCYFYLHWSFFIIFFPVSFFLLGETSDVKIPSVFIAQTEYRALRSIVEKQEKEVKVQLVKDNLLQW
jgi:hypothetical protein